MNSDFIKPLALCLVSSTELLQLATFTGHVGFALKYINIDCKLSFDSAFFNLCIAKSVHVQY